MIGRLPNTLEINGKEYNIRTDYRVVLKTFAAYNSIELTDYEKLSVLIRNIYIDFDKITDWKIAIEKAVWFINGGKNFEKYQKAKKTMDWEQDEQMIFSAVNKVAGFETREKEYIHWWTFLGYFSEIGESLFTSVLHIREKKNQGKKLEKYEQDFYRNNKELINIKQRYSSGEQTEIDRLNKLLSK